MSDIVERLRGIHVGLLGETLDEGADEIERLRKQIADGWSPQYARENERLREALQEIAKDRALGDGAAAIARRALGSQPDKYERTDHDRNAAVDWWLLEQGHELPTNGTAIGDECCVCFRRFSHMYYPSEGGVYCARHVNRGCALEGKQ